MSVLRRFLTVMLLLGLTACGQTGALYLPDESSNVVIRERETPNPSTSPTPAPIDQPPPKVP